MNEVLWFTGNDSLAPKLCMTLDEDSHKEFVGWKIWNITDGVTKRTILMWHFNSHKAL